MNSYSVLDVLAAVIKHLDELTWLLPVDADSFNSSSLSNQCNMPLSGYGGIYSEIRAFTAKTVGE